MKLLPFFSALGTFLRTRKRLWLLPLVVFFLTLALLLLMVSQRSALAPFIYSFASRPFRVSASAKPLCVSSPSHAPAVTSAPALS